MREEVKLRRPTTNSTCYCSNIPHRECGYVVRQHAVQAGAQHRPGHTARQHGRAEGGALAGTQHHRYDQGVPQATHQGRPRLCHKGTDQGAGTLDATEAC